MVRSHLPKLKQAILQPLQTRSRPKAFQVATKWLLYLKKLLILLRWRTAATIKYAKAHTGSESKKQDGLRDFAQGSFTPLVPVSWQDAVDPLETLLASRWNVLP